MVVVVYRGECVTMLGVNRYPDQQWGQSLVIDSQAANSCTAVKEKRACSTEEDLTKLAPGGTENRKFMLRKTSERKRGAHSSGKPQRACCMQTHIWEGLFCHQRERLLLLARPHPAYHTSKNPALVLLVENKKVAAAARNTSRA